MAICRYPQNLLRRRGLLYRVGGQDPPLGNGSTTAPLTTGGFRHSGHGHPPPLKVAMVGVICVSSMRDTMWNQLGRLNVTVRATGEHHPGVSSGHPPPLGHMRTHNYTHPHTLVGTCQVASAPPEVARGPGAPAPGPANGARLAQDPPTPPYFKKISPGNLHL